jgi:hypothetical protein
MAQTGGGAMISEGSVNGQQRTRYAHIVDQFKSSHRICICLTALVERSELARRIAKGDRPSDR